MRLPVSHQAIASISLVVIVLLIALDLAVYANLFNQQSLPDQHQLALPGLPDQTAALLKQSNLATTNPIQQLLPLLSIILVIAGIGGAIIGVLLARRRQQRHRDHQRLQDLTNIAATLEQYYKQHGHYPVSATYDAQYYSAINILTEWSSYNFPSAEEMRHFNPAWPPSDPNFNPTSKDQAGNYLYYPHHFGQRFSLYAQLEAPVQHPAPSYNDIDHLPLTFGKYNYRLNGPDHHQEQTTQGNSAQESTAPVTPASPVKA
jgi:type II secretory pathway pseudopilin PulG